jgi:hypothetical protein
MINKLNSVPYNEGTNIGFDVLEIKPKRLFSRYIERQIIIEELHHPFGDVEKINLVKYIIFQFEVIHLNNDFFLIKIINPPQSLRNFVKTLSGLFHGDFFISRVGIDVEDCFNSLLQSNCISRFSVEKLIASSISFGEKTIASINLRSTDNAYKEFKKRYSNTKYKLDKIMMTLRFNDEWGFIEISSSGLISCTSGLDTLVEKYIKNKELTTTAQDGPP